MAYVLVILVQGLCIHALRLTDEKEKMDTKQNARFESRLYFTLPINGCMAWITNPIYRLRYLSWINHVWI